MYIKRVEAVVELFVIFQVLFQQELKVPLK